MNAGRPAAVLLMVHSLGHGGSERQVANLALAIDRSRFFPHVASVLGGFQADELRRAGVPLLHLPLRGFLVPGVLGVARRLRDYIRANDIRLVHTFDYTATIIGIPVARTCSGVVALSSQRHYMNVVPGKYKYPLLASHRMAHGVVANCEAMRRHVAACQPFPPERVPVCFNGIDTSRFFSSGRKMSRERQDASFTIGTVCVLRPEKNVGQLIQAFARVRNLRPGMKLLIAGSGPEQPALARMAATLGIDNNCAFIPTTDAVAEILSSIDIFVHPSLSEGLPNAVMEAMACGCAVVASRTGGCPEVIDHGETGLLAEPGDLDSLVHQLAVAITNDELRARIGSAAAERVKEFSLDRAARRMEEIYGSYLG